MYSYLSSLEKFGINLGLERIKALLHELDDPQLKFRSIHVAGTNGKGSTSAMIASILKEAGYKVGLYTSPHLFDYTERIKVGCRDISRQKFSSLIAAVKKAAGKLKEPPTVFEVLTAASFLHFARERVDYAVIEVGLGGRLDATNVITPLVSVITNIDIEHKAVLGGTLGRIAAEKAAIIKPGVPVVTAESKPSALSVIKKAAEKNNCLLVRVGKEQPTVKPGLSGEHQKLNAACAVVAVKLAKIDAAKKAIDAGLKKVRWPARFQLVREKPLTIVDGAHNPAGVDTLLRTLRAEYPKRKFVFVIGVQCDKDAALMLKKITTAAQKVVMTRSTHGFSSPRIAGKRTISLREALALSAGCDRVIAGSLFLVADALKILRDKG